jgi:hypothetical protein
MADQKPLAIADHWHWCAVGHFGVVQMMARLSESDLRPSTDTLAALRTTRDQLVKIIDTEQTRHNEVTDTNRG